MSHTVRIGAISDPRDPLTLLSPQERVTFQRATEACQRFTSGHRAPFAVRLAFWELADAEGRP